MDEKKEKRGKGRPKSNIDVPLSELARLTNEKIKNETGVIYGKLDIYKILCAAMSITADELKRGHVVSFGRLGKFEFNMTKIKWIRTKYTNWWWVLTRPAAKLKFKIAPAVLKEVKLLKYLNKDWTNNITPEVLAEHPEDDPQNGYPNKDNFNTARYVNSFMPDWEFGQQVIKPKNYPIGVNKELEDFYTELIAERDKENQE